MTMTDMCDYLNNWFCDKPVFRTHVISGGVFNAPPSAQNDDFFYIKGSKYNDGVHQYGNTNDELIDETFEGTIGVMSVPKAVIELLGDINSYVAKYGDTTPYTAESFGGYSYTRATVNGACVTWQTAFKTRLNRWKKIR